MTYINTFSKCIAYTNAISKFLSKIYFVIYAIVVLIPVSLILAIIYAKMYVIVFVYESIGMLISKTTKAAILKERRINKFEKFVTKNKLSVISVSPLLFKDLNLPNSSVYCLIDWLDRRAYIECVINYELKDYQFSSAPNSYINSIEDLYD